MAYVAFASAGGFAGVRTFRQQEACRDNVAKARIALAEMVADRRRIAPLRPAHCKGLEPHSIEWFEACNAAFCEAMRANPTVRPSAGALNTLNGAGGTR